MLSDLGHFSLVMALSIALVQAIVPLVGSFSGHTSLMSVARPAAQAQFVLMLFAFASLAYAFLTDDFSIKYVADHSNTNMPQVFKFSALWGAHEGSLLLWGFILSVWGFAVSIFSKGLPLDYIARVLSIMGMISIGFLSFMLFTSNPFQELFPAVAQGKELNPLLQDFGLAIHPPMLYMGYVGLSVAFSFAIAALLGGRLDAAWARWSRPWTTTAWIFLSIGIGLGSWWAYYELGWGGWWFWDPVENASFMPWLVATALIHSLAVTEKRGTFKAWTVLLAIIAFSLSLLGTFLVRSGVLTSVHAFTTDPERGRYILWFLAFVIGGSLSLYAWRANQISSSVRLKLFSREGFMLMNNVLLIVITAAVLLGTLAPLIADYFFERKLSIGKEWFNIMFVILTMLLLLIMPIGPLLRWKKDQATRLPSFIKKLFYVIVSLLGVAIILALNSMLSDESSTDSIANTVSNYGIKSIVDLAVIIAGLSLATWNIAGLYFTFKDKFKNKTFNFSNFKALTLSFHGMWIAHLGIIIFVLGATVASNFKDDLDARMFPGDTIALNEYSIKFLGVAEEKGPNYNAVSGKFILSKTTDTGTASTDYQILMNPEKRIYSSQTMPMTEAAIDTTLFRDIYISLGEPLSDDIHGEWIVRVYYKPFQSWLWISIILMGLGGLIAILDKRYRSKGKNIDSKKSSAKAKQQAEKLLSELLTTEKTNDASNNSAR